MAKRSILRQEEVSELASQLRLESLQRSNLLIEERAKMRWITRIFSEQRPRSQGHDAQVEKHPNGHAAGEVPNDDEYLDPKEAAALNIGVPEDNEFFIQFKEAKEREKLELRQRDWERYEAEARQLRREALEKHDADALLVLHSLRKPKKNFTREEVPSFLLRQSFLKDASLQVGEDIPNDQEGLLPPETPPPLSRPTPLRQRTSEKEKKQPSREHTQRLSTLLEPLRPAVDNPEREEPVRRDDQPVKRTGDRALVESPRRHIEDMCETLDRALERQPTELPEAQKVLSDLPEQGDKEKHPPQLEAEAEEPDARTTSIEESDVEVMLREQQALQQRLQDISAALAKKLGRHPIRSDSVESVNSNEPIRAGEAANRTAQYPVVENSGTTCADRASEEKTPENATEGAAAENNTSPEHVEALGEKLPDNTASLCDASLKSGEPSNQTADEPQTAISDETPLAQEQEQPATEAVPVDDAPERKQAELSSEANDQADSRQEGANELQEELLAVDCDDAVPQDSASNSEQPPAPVAEEGQIEQLPASPEVEEWSSDRDAAVHVETTAPAQESARPTTVEEINSDRSEESQDEFVGPAELQLLLREEAYFRARLHVTESDYRDDLRKEEQHRQRIAEIAPTRTFSEQACETTPRLRGPPDPQQESLMEEEAFLRGAIIASERQSAELLLQRVEEILEEHAAFDVASPKRALRIQQQLFHAEHDAVFQEEGKIRLQIIATYNREIVEGVAAVFNLSMLVLNLTEEEFTSRLQISMSQTTHLAFIRRFVRYVHTSDVIVMSSNQLRENMFQDASSAVEQRKVEVPSVEPFDFLQAQEHAGRREILRKRLTDEQHLKHASFWLAGAASIWASQHSEAENAFSFAAQSIELDVETERRRAARLMRLEQFDRHVEEQDSLTTFAVDELRAYSFSVQAFRHMFFSGTALVQAQEALSEAFVGSASREYQVFAEFAAQQLSKHHERSIRLAGKEVDRRSAVETEEAFLRSLQASFVQLFTFKLLLVQDVFVDSCQRLYDESSERVAQVAQRAALRLSMRKALSDAPAYDTSRQELRAPTEPPKEQPALNQELPNTAPEGTDDLKDKKSESPSEAVTSIGAAPTAEQKEVARPAAAVSRSPRPAEDPFHQHVIETRETSARNSIEAAASAQLSVIAGAEAVCSFTVLRTEEFAHIGAILLSRIFTDSMQLALALHKISKAELEARSFMEYDSLLCCGELLRLITLVSEGDAVCTLYLAKGESLYEGAVEVEAMKAANRSEVALEAVSREGVWTLEQAQWDDLVRAHNILISRCVLYRVTKKKLELCYNDVGTFFVESLLCAVPAEESEVRSEIDTASTTVLRDILRYSNLFVACSQAVKRMLQKHVDAYITSSADALILEDATVRKGAAQKFIAFMRRLAVEEVEGNRRLALLAEAEAYYRPILLYGETLNRICALAKEGTEAVVLSHRSAFAAVLDAANRRVRLLEKLAAERADVEQEEAGAREMWMSVEEAFFVSGAQRYKRYIEAVTGFEKKCVALKITFCEQFEAKFQQQLMRRGTQSDLQALRRTSTVATLASMPSMVFTSDQRSASMGGAQMAAQMALSELDNMPPGLREHGLGACKSDPSVTGIVLRNLGEDLTERVIENLVALLTVRPTPIGSVDLSHNDGTIPQLLPSVVKLFRLTRELNLSSCGLNASHESALVNALSDPSNSLVTLRCLMLDDNNLPASCCASFGRVIRNTNFTLTKLTLSGNPLVQQNQQRLVQFLCDTNRHDKPIKARILALESKQSSADADFGAKMGPDGFERVLDDITARCICVALSSNTTCAQVSMRGQKLSDRAATLFAHLLRTNAVLTHLDLSHNLIGDKGARELAAALQTNTTLLELHLDGNQISDASILAQLADKCRRNAHEVMETATYSARERNGT